MKKRPNRPDRPGKPNPNGGRGKSSSSNRSSSSRRDQPPTQDRPPQRDRAPMRDQPSRSDQPVRDRWVAPHLQLQQESNPRAIAVIALSQVAENWPDSAMLEPDMSALAHRDLRLARAIYRTALQRWMTLVHVLDRFLTKPLWEMEHLMQGVLLAGATQLLFMDRLPSHAVVDEMVTLAKIHVRPGAGGLTNAVLRKVARLVDEPVHGKTWHPAVDRLPLENGYVPLTEPILPPLPARQADENDPQTIDMLARHLQAATSHPAPLVRQWLSAYGREKTIAICWHGLVNPPLIISHEPKMRLDPELLEPHDRPGFALWKGIANQLPGFLQKNPARRVQDPASAKAVESTADLSPGLILDLCAGRGTKTRQLALLHPKATVIASDPAAFRLEDFSALGKLQANVRIASPQQLDGLLKAGKADLILLDVPCSNTGVLARRPGARYRYNDITLSSLVTLQQQIVTQAMTRLARPGWLLYSTCSLEKAENQQQTAWIIKQFGGRVVEENQTLPAGRGKSYHDASYHALIAFE